jgi:prophage maintenance system killer protein
MPQKKESRNMAPACRPPDGNKRVAFAAGHTFLLVNGYDLEVRPLAAYEFMMQSIARGEFRFGAILKWINNHIRQG